MIIVFIAIVTGILFFLLLTILYFSPGRSELFYDSKGKPLEGSISEKTFVAIGGIQQGMFIKSRNH